MWHRLSEIEETRPPAACAPTITPGRLTIIFRIVYAAGVD